MNERLLADLDAFGRGDLVRDELTASHGGEATALLAMHDRMLAVAAATPVLDADAGWAALSTQLDAVVLPLKPRPRVRRRTMAFAVAAALVMGGSAFAATRAGWFDDPVVPTPPSGAENGDDVVPGSGLGGPAAAAPDRLGSRPERVRAGPSDPDDEGGAPGTPDDDDAPDGSTGGTGGTGDKPDDPNDHDQGTGNDGDHDDQGGGNDGQEGDQGGGPGDQGGGPGDQGTDGQGRATGPPGA